MSDASTSVPQRKFYVDPVNGSDSNSGTDAAPWRSLQAAVNKVPEGSTLYLRTGDHGSVAIKRSPGEIVNVCSEAGHRPVIRELKMNRASNWCLANILFQAVREAPPAYLVRLQEVENVSISGCRLESAPDAHDWSDEEWIARACGGIMASGKNITIHNNSLRFVRRGIVVGSNVLTSAINVLLNEIDYFSDDAINTTACGSVINRNRITNHRGVSGNHNDGIQVWAADTPVLCDVTISKNTLIESTGSWKRIPPIPSGEGADHMQGITCFDDRVDGLLIEQNFVACSAHHGISVSGGRIVTIFGNTLVKLSSNRARPWIGVFAGKTSKRHPESCVVSDNHAINATFVIPEQLAETYTSSIVAVRNSVIEAK